MNDYPEENTLTRCPPLDAWAEELKEHDAYVTLHWDMLRMAVTGSPRGNAVEVTDLWAPKRPRSKSARSTKSTKSAKKAPTRRTRSKRTEPDVDVEPVATQDTRPVLVEWNDQIVDLTWWNSLDAPVPSWN